ncbi:MAG: MFS transporter [Legionellaceae bacterium]|nr:MFS transporter [Legionellaceae bacterium]
MLKNIQFSRKGFVVWGICALSFLYEFFLRSSLGTFQHPLMQDLHLTSVEYSLLSSTLFLVIYGFMQVPVGLLIDNIGLKKTLLMGSFICAMASFGFAYSETYLFAVVMRMLMGLGASVGFLCLLVSVNEWMPHRYNALFIGLSQFIGTMGPMLGAGPLENLANQAHMSWQLIFKYLGVLGFGLFFLVYLCVENNHEKTQQYVVLKRPENKVLAFLKLFSYSQAWYIALFSAAIYFPIEYLSENEGRIFLGLKGFSPNFASYMITVSWMGYALGCPLLGFLSDYFERRKNVLSFSAVLGILALVLIIYAPQKLLVMSGFFLLGVAASGQSVGFAIIGEQFKKQFVVIGLALNEAMITGFAAVNAPVIGWFIDRSKHHALEFRLHDYHMAFSILFIIVITAVIFSFFYIKETFCKSVVDFNCLKPNQAEDCSK